MNFQDSARIGTLSWGCCACREVSPAVNLLTQSQVLILVNYYVVEDGLYFSHSERR
ncbi:uncharacterized protein PHALS_13683 [Plasmopara halstedii]|uniref:Uncharacterized protein n=1 Tax=Plasmopara halstedii TaxID=4781 RepID=A0A0P1AQG9_PLAHL|nr:uncharacterized protein PHALS_13683 [Plasmopara halstedii]CEG43490.1 hypothetical protein PHALS_13683 [Plasmopara halstedii]|eukprot:XP_024579859.1 hypothetical protein PHALS_13683 [Plasmopara halstedii]